MLKNYKKSYLVINIILSVLIAFLLINFIFFKSTSYLFLFFSIFIPSSLIIAIFGYEKKKRRFTYELIFYIFAYCITFLIFTYMVGTITGFTKNIYKINLTNIIHNIIPYFLLICTSEVLRYEIIRKGEGSKLSYILVTIILIMVDMTLFLNNYNLTNGDDLIKFICIIFLPSVFKNIILLYFTYNGGIHPSLLYRLILDLKIVILPIFPDFGMYFEAIVNTITPIIIGFIIYVNLLKYKNKDNETKQVKLRTFYKYLFVFILLGVACLMNILSSGKFKYSLVSIGSGSMTPVICKGDAVLYERIHDNNLPDIGEVIVFKKDTKVVIHRVIEIVEVNDNEKVYYTKGDANAEPDGYPINLEDIKGIVKFNFKYIGIPSVALGELLN